MTCWIKKKHLSDVGDFLISPLNPIKRHRILYGWKWGWLLYSFFITLIVVGIVWVVCSLGKISSENLLGSSSGADSAEHKELVWAIISQFADPGNLHMSQNGKGAWVALLCATTGVVCLSGLLVSSLVSFISRRKEDWQKGEITYNRWLGRSFCLNDFVVIIGVNEQTATIVKSSLRKGADYVLIQSNRDIERVRMRVNLLLDEDYEKRVIFYHGERTSAEDIGKLRLQDAREVYILGEDMRCSDELDHDSYNMTCLELVADYMQSHPRKQKKWWLFKTERKERLKCHVNFEFQGTFMAFKFTHLYRSLNHKIEFFPFNIYEIWAKKVLADNQTVIQTGKRKIEQKQEYYPVDMYWEKNGEVRTPKFINEDSRQTVHLVVIGMNRMGVAMAMQAALLIHLPNYQKNHKLRTTITFIDENAVREGEYLRSKYDALFSLCIHRTVVCNRATFSQDAGDFDVAWHDPMQSGRYAHLNPNFMDLQWEFIEGNVASDSVRSYMSAIVAEEKQKTCTFAVCFSSPQQSIATALYLPEMVLKRALQILVYQQNSFDMINSVATSEKEWKRYERLRPFGMIEGCYTEGTFDNMLAKFVNLIYAFSDKPQERPSEIKEICSCANRLWTELGIVDKYSNIDLVDSFGMKLRALGATEQEQSSALKEGTRIHNLARAEHNRWITERLTMGFRPLDLEELKLLQTQGQQGDRYSKAYYKKKSRAHLDICANEDIEFHGRDEEVRKRNMDETIIKMIFTLKQWIQLAANADIAR